jgi:hypothetical protein
MVPGELECTLESANCSLAYSAYFEDGDGSASLPEGEKICVAHCGLREYAFRRHLLLEIAN